MKYKVFVFIDLFKKLKNVLNSITILIMLLFVIYSCTNVVDSNIPLDVKSSLIIKNRLGKS